MEEYWTYFRDAICTISWACCEFPCCRTITFELTGSLDLVLTSCWIMPKACAHIQLLEFYQFSISGSRSSRTLQFRSKLLSMLRNPMARLRMKRSCRSFDHIDQFVEWHPLRDVASPILNPINRLLHPSFSCSPSRLTSRLGIGSATRLVNAEVSKKDDRILPPCFAPGW